MIPPLRSVGLPASADSRQEKWISIGWIFLILSFPVCFIWQGLDVTDTGYALENCQHFFQTSTRDIDSNIAAVWLSYFLGAVWYKMTGGCGLIGFRVLSLLLTYFTAGLVFGTIRGFGRNASVLVALLAGVLAVTAKTLFLPSYNEFTAAAMTLTAILLYRGLVKERRLLVFLSGVCGGAAVFARLPNLGIFGLMVGIAFYYAICSPGKGVFARAALFASLRTCALFALGCGAGLLAGFVLLLAVNSGSAYVEMLRRVKLMLGSSASHHGGAPLLRGMLHDYFYASLAGLVFIPCAGVVGWVGARYRRAIFPRILAALCGLGLLFTMLRYEDFEVYFWPGVLYATLCVGALGILSLSKEYRLLCVIASIVLFVTPLGSNNGIYNGFYAMCLVLPCALMGLLARPGGSNCNVPGGEETDMAPPGSAANLLLAVRGLLRQASRAIYTKNIDTVIVGQALVIAVIGFAAIHRWQFTYRDSPDRRQMVASVNHPKLHGVFTTSSRARSVGELLSELGPLVKKNDYLLDHMQIPLVYFLTETRPYLFSSWANLNDPVIFKDSLDRALASRITLPVCVKTKVDTCNPRWPEDEHSLETSYRSVENQRLIDSFLRDHSYRKRWENTAFEIWVPPLVKSS